MRKVLSLGLFAVFALAIASPVLAAPIWNGNPEGFVYGIKLEINGNFYYFLNPAGMLIPDSDEPYRQDVPGHAWVQTGPAQVEGRHYNVEPWWTMTDAPYGVLIFKVHGIIDRLPDQLAPQRAVWLKSRGYVHFHELVDADTGEVVESPVVYLRHTGVRMFSFMGNTVDPGIYYGFMPNW